MNIVFFCQSCGSRFEVDPRAAGKKGRCRRCGQLARIPRAEEIASMSAIAVPAADAAARRPAPPPLRSDSPATSIGAWLKDGISQVGLAPLSEVHRPAVRPALAPALDLEADSKPYALARPIAERGGSPRILDNGAVRLWRREVGLLQKVFRWLNESAYFVSIPFVMILLIGAAVKSRPLALFGATFVVVLNVGRLAAGVVNLALVPLRDGLSARKLKHPARRVAEPIATIAAVFLGFTFIPWLSADRPADGNLGDRLRESATGLQKEIEGEVEKVIDKAERVDVKGIKAEARRRLDGLSGDTPRDGP